MLTSIWSWLNMKGSNQDKVTFQYWRKMSCHSCVDTFIHSLSLQYWCEMAVFQKCCEISWNPHYMNTHNHSARSLFLLVASCNKSKCRRALCHMNVYVTSAINLEMWYLNYCHQRPDWNTDSPAYACNLSHHSTDKIYSPFLPQTHMLLYSSRATP